MANVKLSEVPVNAPLFIADGVMNPLWIMFFQRLLDAVKQLQP